MQIIINDANILIDLLKIDIVDSIFQLPYQMHTTEGVLAEVEDPNKKVFEIYIKANQFQVKVFEYPEIVSITQGEKMELVLVPDIFGRTPALETICEALSQAASDIQIIDPYNGVNHNFETQAHAYDYFMDQVGLKKYQAILKDRLIHSGPGIVLIGFSVGASAIWGISQQSSLKQIQKAFCFYGSRIRQQTRIDPIFDIELIFPEQEPHFDVDDLIKGLHKKDRVTCKKASGLHGFMNELSPDFDPACYTDFIEHLKASLRQCK